MARYAEYSDVQLEIDERLLIRLTDDEGIGAPDQVTVERYLDKASDMINGKVGMRYSLPVATPPPIFKTWNVDLAVYLLLGRRQDSPGEIWQSRYDSAMSDLNSVAVGKMSLGLDDPETTGGRQPASHTSSDRVFTRSTLRGW